MDGENNNIDRDEDTKSEVDEDSDKGSEQDEDEGALHINTVNVRSQARENERVCLRVCVEITHPALKLPVYRTWTGTAQQWMHSDELPDREAILYLFQVC